MRAARFDRQVRKEAELLARDARAALALRRNLRGKAGELSGALAAIDSALAARDYQRVRHALPALDALVDELIKRPNKSTTRDYIESIGAAVLIALALRAVVVEAFKIPSTSMNPTLEVNDHIFVNKVLYGLRIPFTTIKLFEWRKPERGEVIVFIQPCEPDKDYIKRVVATEGQSVEVRCNVIYVDGNPVESAQVEPSSCPYNDYIEEDKPAGIEARWRTVECSEYAERVGDRSYHTYHDLARPARDLLAKQGRLTTPDQVDFPKFGDRVGPYCGKSLGNPTPTLGLNQQFGTVVETRAGAPACEPQLHYVVPAGHVFVMGDNRANSNDSRYWGSVPIQNIKGKALFIWFSYGDWELSPKVWRLWPTIRWGRIGNFVND